MVDPSEYLYGKNGDRPELYGIIPESIPGKKLDIGSAYGSWVKKNYPNTITIDQRGGADVIGDIHSMPFRDMEFSAVFCFEVLEHTKNPKKAVSEIKRILTREGVAYVSTPFFYEIHGEEYGDYWRFTKQGLQELFKNFSKTEIIPFGKNRLKPHHYLVKAKK